MSTYVAKNLQSALNEADVTSALLDKELNKGYLVHSALPPFLPSELILSVLPPGNIPVKSA